MLGTAFHLAALRSGIDLAVRLFSLERARPAPGPRDLPEDMLRDLGLLDGRRHRTRDPMRD